MFIFVSETAQVDILIHLRSRQQRMVGLFVIDITVKMEMGDNSEYYLGTWILPMKNQ